MKSELANPSREQCPSTSCAPAMSLCALVRSGLWKENPIFVQILGICSALAVTNRVANALVMSGAVVLVTGCSSAIVSALRGSIPRRIRMIAEVALIATFVILFDQILKAFYYEMSKALGPYVGLIITNCIVMGRAEGFALRNPPLRSFLDGAGNGLGYSFVLCTISIFRELLGTGRIALFGRTLVSLPTDYPECQFMLLAPGAFLMMGLMIWVMRGVAPMSNQQTNPH